MIDKDLLQKYLHDIEPKIDPLKIELVYQARQIIRESGVAGLKARKLAERSGCAVGAIYLRFADMNQVMHCVNYTTFRFAYANLQPEIDWAARGDVRLKQLGRYYIKFAKEQKTLWEAVFSTRYDENMLVPEWQKLMVKQLFNLIETALAELFPIEDAPQLPSLARVLFSAMHGHTFVGVERRFIEYDVDHLEEHMDWLVDSIISGHLQNHK